VNSITSYYRAASSSVKSHHPSSFCILFLLICICTLLYYFGELVDFASWTFLGWGLFYTHHDLLQLLFLIPIIFSGYIFGLKWGIFITIVCFVVFLPGALSNSASPATVVRSVVFILFAGTISSLIGIIRENSKNKGILNEQEQAVARQLRISEERYRQLFQNAYDAIWINDMDGNIIVANDAARKFNGFKVEDLSHTSVNSIFSEESLHLANEIRTKLLRAELVIQPYELKLKTREGKEIILKLTTNVVRIDERPIGFQHIAMDITEQKRLQENLRFYSHLVLKSLEEERARISNELYEEVIQVMTVHARQLDEVLNTIKGISEKNRTLVEALLQQTHDIIQGLRRLGSGLRSPVLDSLGLLAALQSLAQDLTERSGIQTTVEIRGSEYRLQKDIELILFRATEEALKNILRHSNSTEAQIIVEFDENKTRVTISDNGKGSNIPKVISDLVRDGKLGLALMQERVTSAGGTFAIECQSGKGTNIRVELPKQPSINKTSNRLAAFPRNK
jgi:PAS domain S-box-containing protein